MFEDVHVAVILQVLAPSGTEQLEADNVSEPLGFKIHLFDQNQNAPGDGHVMLIEVGPEYVLPPLESPSHTLVHG